MIKIMCLIMIASPYPSLLVLFQCGEDMDGNRSFGRGRITHMDRVGGIGSVWVWFWVFRR